MTPPAASNEVMLETARNSLAVAIDAGVQILCLVPMLIEKGRRAACRSIVRQQIVHYRVRTRAVARRIHVSAPVPFWMEIEARLQVIIDAVKQVVLESAVECAAVHGAACFMIPALIPQFVKPECRIVM